MIEISSNIWAKDETARHNLLSLSFCIYLLRKKIGARFEFQCKNATFSKRNINVPVTLLHELNRVWRDMNKQMYTWHLVGIIFGGAADQTDRFEYAICVYIVFSLKLSSICAMAQCKLKWSGKLSYNFSNHNKKLTFNQCWKQCIEFDAP